MLAELVYKAAGLAIWGQPQGQERVVILREMLTRTMWSTPLGMQELVVTIDTFVHSVVDAEVGDFVALCSVPLEIQQVGELVVPMDDGFRVFELERLDAQPFAWRRVS
jgi:hypothetical protein